MNVYFDQRKTHSPTWQGAETENSFNDVCQFLISQYFVFAKTVLRNTEDKLALQRPLPWPLRACQN